MPMRDRMLETDAQLHEQLAQLLARANRRQFWLFFLGADHRILDPIMPMDDHPDLPDEMCESEDLGRIPFAQLIVDRAGSVMEMVGADSIVFVWERPGPPKPTENDLHWARAIAREADRLRVTLRAQFLLHDGGLRRFADAEQRGSGG